MIYFKIKILLEKYQKVYKKLRYSRDGVGITIVSLILMIVRKAGKYIHIHSKKNNIKKIDGKMKWREIAIRAFYRFPRYEWEKN